MNLDMLKGLAKKNEFVSVALCVLLVVVLTLFGGVFWSPSNLNSLQTSIAPTTIMALGMMMLLICGYFDLSIGSIMLLSGILCGKFFSMGLPLPLVVVLVLVCGFVAGCVNGFLVSVLKINALIATIGTQYAGYGLAMTIWDNIRGFGKFPDKFIHLGDGYFLGLYYMTWVMLVLLAVFTYFLKMSSGGRKLYFVGGNAEAARLMGFNDKRIVFLVFALTGLLASVAGVLSAARIQSPSQYMGDGIHMTCMIACVVGGGSFAGGKGSAVGAVLGVAFMSLLTNMFNLLEMKTQLQNVVVGLILVLVIVMDGAMNLRKMRAMGKI